MKHPKASKSLGEQLPLFEPGSHSLCEGLHIWVRYTYSQWLPCQVVMLSARRALVWRNAGTHGSLLWVPYADLAWDKPAASL